MSDGNEFDLERATEAERALSLVSEPFMVLKSLRERLKRGDLLWNRITHEWVPVDGMRGEWLSGALTYPRQWMLAMTKTAVDKGAANREFVSFRQLSGDERATPVDYLIGDKGALVPADELAVIGVRAKFLGRVFRSESCNPPPGYEIVPEGLILPGDILCNFVGDWTHPKDDTFVGLPTTSLIGGTHFCVARPIAASIKDNYGRW